MTGFNNSSEYISDYYLSLGVTDVQFYDSTFAYQIVLFWNPSQMIAMFGISCKYRFDCNLYIITAYIHLLNTAVFLFTRIFIYYVNLTRLTYLSLLVCLRYLDI